MTVILGTTAHSFYNTLGIGATEAGEEFGVDVEIQGAQEFSPTAQEPVINAVIESQPDALLIALTSPTALNETIRAAAEAGIVVFTVDNDTDVKELRHTNISSDNTYGGEVAGHTLATAIGESGSAIGLASSPGPLIEQIRLEGFTNGIGQYSGITQLDTQFCGAEPTGCATDTTNLMQANADLRGIFAVGEPMGVGAGNAVRNEGSEDVVVGAFDASPAQQRDLEEGIVDFLVVQRPYQIGYEAIRIVSEFLSGADVSQSPLLPEGSSPGELPDPIHVPFAVAVNDEAMCPDLDDVACGLFDDPDITQWYYQG